MPSPSPSCFFFFNDTATTDIYTLSLHDALPISGPKPGSTWRSTSGGCFLPARASSRSEEHTSELQSRVDLVCRLLLEKKHTGLRVLVSYCDKSLTYVSVARCAYD